MLTAVQSSPTTSDQETDWLYSITLVQFRVHCTLGSCVIFLSWLVGSVAECQSLTGELSLICTGPAADG